MNVVFRPGFWTDATDLPDGRFVQVTSDLTPPVRAFDGATGALLWSRDVGRGLANLRCATFSDGRVFAIGTEHDSAPNKTDGGTAFLVTSVSTQPLGLTFGVQPVAIDSTYVYIVRSGQSYERLRLDNGQAETFPHGVPGSSQGILDVEPGGVIRWADTSRTKVIVGITLTFPNTRGLVDAITVGQTDPAQIAGVFQTTDISTHPPRRVDLPFTAINGVGFEPHVAQSGDRYAIVARTPKGAAYIEGPPFPSFIGAAPPPDPPPVVVPPATPPPIVVPPPPDPPPVIPEPTTMRSDSYWFMPNIASNILDLFRPGVDVLGNVGVFELVAQHIFSDRVVGPNTYEALMAADVFRTLRVQRIALSVGMGVIKEWDPDGSKNLAALQPLVDRITVAGGELAWISMDEPLTGYKIYLRQQHPGIKGEDVDLGLRAQLPALAASVARFITAANTLGINTTWDEAWPEVDLETMRDFFDLLDVEHGALPNAIHFDIDHIRQKPDASIVQQIRDWRSDVGWPSAVILAPYKHATEPEYQTDLLAWARDLKALAMPMDRLPVMSWVEGFTEPGVFKMVEMLNQVVEIFE